MKDLKKIIFTFLFGGFYFLLIYYAANIIKNPDLSAILCLLPLSLICGYIIYDREILKKHALSVIPTIMITALLNLVLYYLLVLNIERYSAITGAIILWVIVQYIRIKFFDIHR